MYGYSEIYEMNVKEKLTILLRRKLPEILDDAANFLYHNYAETADDTKILDFSHYKQYRVVTFLQEIFYHIV